MDSWERFDENSLPDKKVFYCELNLEDIIDKDYSHAQKVFKEFCIYVSEYHKLYVQSDHYYLQIYLKISEINILNYMDLILYIFGLQQD